MRFSSDFIDRVQEANNLVDLIGQYTQLRPTGGDGYMGRCPFPQHPEKTPSFSVSEAKQVYHCFGCRRSGNIFSFLRDYLGLPFVDAVEFLASRAGIPLPPPPMGSSVFGSQPSASLSSSESSLSSSSAVLSSPSSLSTSKVILQLNKQAMEFFHETLRGLPPNHPCKVYIRKRGITDELIETFRLGWAPEDGKSLVQFLQGRHQVSSKRLLEACLARERNGSLYDLFRGRLIFPISNLLQNTLAFGGRTIHPEGEPKYLNSPETPVFRKGKVLYGLAQAGRYIRSEDMALVVEGYMDLISLYRSDCRNVVAVMSTAITLDHGKSLRRLTRNVILLLDGDSAGIGGALRSLPILLKSGLHPKVVVLPEGMDPDDFIGTHGVEALRTRVTRAQDLFSFALESVLRSRGGGVQSSDKVKICEELRPALEGLVDSRLKGLYLNEMAQGLQVSLGWLQGALRGSGSGRQNSSFLSSGASSPGSPRRGFRGVEQEQQDSLLSEGSQGGGQPEGLGLVGALVPGFSSTPEGDESSPSPVVLRGAPGIELALLRQALHTRNCWEAFRETGVFSEITHPGVRRVLDFISVEYGQNPSHFDKLLGRVSALVDDVGLLMPSSLLAGSGVVRGGSLEREERGINPVFSSGGGPSSSLDTDLRLVADIVKKIRQAGLRRQAKKMAQEIALQQYAAPETLSDRLKVYMDLQKSRLALEKE